MLELWLAFIAGMFSSIHCIGMCGPIIMGCVAPRPVQISVAESSVALPKRESITPHLLYNSGRVVSYGIIGMIAGLIGSAAIFSAKLQSGFGIVLGSIMIGMAFFQMNLYPAFLRRERVHTLPQRLFASIKASKAAEAKFLIGFLTPLLPCGLLYGMAAHAGASSSPLTGAMEMSAFALGSVPTLLLTGFLSGMLSMRIRKLGTTFAALLLIVMGLLTIARGAGIYHGVQLPGQKEHVCNAVQ